MAKAIELGKGNAKGTQAPGEGCRVRLHLLESTHEVGVDVCQERGTRAQGEEDGAATDERLYVATVSRAEQRR